MTIKHGDHADILFNGHLYHYNSNSGKIEIHDI